MANVPVDQEARIQAAITALNNHEVPSVRQAAIRFDVPRSTLQDRFSGRRQANKTSKQHMQRLTVEEDSIVKAVYQLDDLGCPMSISATEHLASQLLLAKGDTKPLGKCWYWNFLDRHSELKARRSQAMDQSREDAMDHQTLEQSSNLPQAPNITLDALNQELVKKRLERGEKGTRKHVGEARVLTVEAIREQRREREEKQDQEARAKARRAALRGVVGFAKTVWKEMPDEYGYFD